MDYTGYVGVMEFMLVVLFALGWGILELVGRHLDRKREAEKAKDAAHNPSQGG